MIRAGKMSTMIIKIVKSSSFCTYYNSTNVTANTRVLPE